MVVLLVEVILVTVEEQVVRLEVPVLSFLSIPRITQSL
jgi:hypothetical protein